MVTTHPRSSNAMSCAHCSTTAGHEAGHSYRTPGPSATPEKRHGLSTPIGGSPTRGRLMPEAAGPRSLRQLVDAMLAVSSDLDLHDVLEHIVESARDLAGAQY